MIADHVRRVKIRIGLRRGPERGLTIIELLLSLTLLSLIAGFLAGGLQMARRAFDADRKATLASEIDQAVDVLANQVVAAFPLKDWRSGKLDFVGRPNAVGFAGLDQGRANRAGLQHATIRQVGGDLTIAVTSPALRSDAVVATSPIVLLGNIAEVQFSYFGVTAQADSPAWRRDWLAMDRLPDLVSIRIEFRDQAQAPVTVLVAIRQRV